MGFITRLKEIFKWCHCCKCCNRQTNPGIFSRIIVPSHRIDSDTLPKSHPHYKYATNRIKTTKYTILTFIPLNLLEQLQRVANLFFIFIVVINFLPLINAFAKEVAVLPVLFVLGATAGKDIYEDHRRYKSDKKVNNSLSRKYNGTIDKKYETCKWQDISAGDIVHLSCDEVIPADILLLHSSDEAGLCFIETSNLDGESNLKQRQVVRGYHERSHFHPVDFKCDVECDVPNTELYRFNGSLIHPDGTKIGISKDNLLLRGCTLRNTDYVEGIVVYAGHETKALLNNGGPRHKRSKLERQINKDVIWCVVLLAILCFAGGIGHGLWFGSYSNPQDVSFLSLYTEDQLNAGYQGFLVFWTHLIILQVMIPLPMYVTIEIVKLGQTLLINQDIELYHEPTNKRVECRALNITEDLGQIQYIFSDKTGTLTENRMVFRCCSIGGKDYSHFTENDELLEEKCINDLGSRMPNLDSESKKVAEEEEVDEDEFIIDGELQQEVTNMSICAIDSTARTIETHRIQDFFLLMAVCNTVVVSSQPHRDKSADVRSNGRNGNGKVRNVNTLEDEKVIDEKGDHRATVMDEADFIGYGPDSASEDADDDMEEIQICYEAESPDELALVKAAYRYGCRLIRRTQDTVQIWLPAEGYVTFRVLHILTFDTTRKRMSVIIQYPNTNQIVLLCKGADSSILNNLETRNDDFDWEQMVQSTKDHINHYAKNGLRTLCMAKKNLSLADYQKWNTMMHEADCAIENKDELTTKAYKEMENNLTLIGATGIEDNLQEGVPETIDALRKAGINIWVLTGDKQETALNIAYSCKLMAVHQSVIILNATGKEQTEKLIRDNLRMVTRTRQPGPNIEIRQGHRRPAIKRDYALVIDGITLSFALEKSIEKEFLSLAEQCTSVLCCRATPLQKASVVELVKVNLKMTTLAIGDGANDVSMIQKADIGVGISGQEGMQAVMASDFAIARFYHLERLLLVHGHWCYDRLARMCLYMFYKSSVFVFVLFWYNLYNGFSSSLAVDQFYTILHNLLFTSLPPVIFGLFDKDCDDKVLLTKPHLYRAGQNCKSYLPWSFWVNIVDALWQSLTMFYVCYLMYSGTSVGMAEFGTTMITGCFFLNITTLGVETKSVIWINWFVWIASTVLMWVFMAVFSTFALGSVDMPLNIYGVFFVCWTTPLYWLGLMLITIIGILPRLAVRSAKSTINPSDINASRQQDHQENFGSFYSRTASAASLRRLTAGSMASLNSQGGYMSDYGHSRASLRSKRRRSSAHRLPATTHVTTHSVSRSMPYLNADSRPMSPRSRPPLGKNVAPTSASSQSTPIRCGHRRQHSEPLTSVEMHRMVLSRHPTDV